MMYIVRNLATSSRKESSNLKEPTSYPSYLSTEVAGQK